MKRITDGNRGASALVAVLLLTMAAATLARADVQMASLANPAVRAAGTTPAAVAKPAEAATPTAATTLHAATAAEHAAPTTFRYGRFGAVQLFRPSGQTTSVTLLLAGDDGWDATLAALADALVGHGSVVVGIDARRYLQAVDQPGDGCVFMGFDFEDLSHAVQRHLGLRDYMVPVVAGAGSGATLAAIVVEQSPRGTYAGLLSVAFRPGIALRREPCAAPGLAWEARRGSGDSLAGLVLQPATRRSAPWVMLQDSSDRRFPLDAARRFAAASAATTLVALRGGSGAGNGVGAAAGIDEADAVGAAWLAAQQSLAASAARLAPATPGALGDLPLHEVPVPATTTAAASDLFAVLLTGDGGWAGLDQDVAGTLAQAGIPVVALNSLKYFWTRREPEAAARDLQRIVARYGEAWRRHGVLLVGYSFGASVLPFLYRRLPAATRDAVRSVTLLAPERAAQFEFHVSSWLPVGGARGRPVRPEIEAMGAARVLCIHPLGEGASPCDAARLPRLANVALAGGHHFGGDYQGLAQRILQSSGARTPAQ